MRHYFSCYSSLALLSLLFIAQEILTGDRIVVLIPFNEFDTTDAIFEGGSTNFWYRLKVQCAQAGYHLTTQRNYQNPYALVAFNSPRHCSINAYKAAKKILYIWEPPTIWPPNFYSNIHQEYDLVMTWHDQLAMATAKKYRKFNYALQFEFPRTVVPFHERKLCAMFVGNRFSAHPHELYSKRLEMIRYLECHAADDFDLYGLDWAPEQHPTYRGYVDNKVNAMRNYKFIIAYENMRDVPGYITEKIFDVFSAGCVPLYWGASNVIHYIPQNCFIAREHFHSDEQLYTFLKNMPESQYNQYLIAIKNFLISDAAKVFSCDQLLQSLSRPLMTLRYTQGERR